MRELNLDQLRTLVAIVELGSFSAAARALHLSQPTVSLHVAELESRFSTVLLVRGGRRVTPTSSGEVLVARARLLLRDSADTVDLMNRQQRGERGRVRLGTSSGAMVHLLPQILERLDAARTGVEVDVMLGRSQELMAKLFVGGIDIALVATPQPDYPGIEVTPWRDTPMLAMLPSNWSGPKIATPRWMAQRPLIFNEPTTHVHQQTMAWFAAAGLHPVGRIEISHNEVARRLIATGYGAAILPFEDASETLEGRVRAVALRPAVTRRLAVAYPESKADLGEMRRVLGIIDEFRQLLG